MRSDLILINQALERLDQAMEDLSPLARQIFVLHRTESLTREEIARRLNLDAATVELELVDALAQLERRIFEEQR